MSMNDMETEAMALLAVTSARLTFMEGMKFTVDLFAQHAQDGKSVVETLDSVIAQAGNGAYDDLSEQVARRVVGDLAEQMGKVAGDAAAD